MAKSYREDDTRIQMLEFIAPDYKAAHMIVSKKKKDLYRITFAISPSSMGETRSNGFQSSRTNAGWMLQRMGPAPVSLNFDGYMLDTEGYLEKHQFLEHWKNFLSDKQGSGGEYKNDYSVRIICMGREYYGVMQSIVFQAAGTQPFLQRYSFSFMCYGDKYIYKPDQPKISMSKGTYGVADKIKTSLGRTVYGILTK